MYSRFTVPSVTSFRVCYSRPIPFVTFGSMSRVLLLHPPLRYATLRIMRLRHETEWNVGSSGGEW